MKVSALFVGLLPAALAAPSTGETGIVKRQTATTDQYLFSYSLANFLIKRNAKSPATLNWTSDGCSNSPDNPLGFPFNPACYRHDFGYRNYKAQGRFTDANKLRIDDQPTPFEATLTDNDDNNSLLYQCSSNGHGGVCESLAWVYYKAVRAFGREAPIEKREEANEDALMEYLKAVEAYNKVLAEALAAGETSF